jgi:hypothetical protein
MPAFLLFPDAAPGGDTTTQCRQHFSQPVDQVPPDAVIRASIVSRHTCGLIVRSSSKKSLQYDTRTAGRNNRLMLIELPKMMAQSWD